MTGEAFGFGKCDGVGADVLEAGVRVVLHRDDLDEVEHAETAANASDAAGGKNVVGAADVIAHRLRGVRADKDAARIFDPGEVGFGVDRKVLGGEAVGELVGFCSGLGYEDAALGGEGLGGDVVCGGLAFDLGGDVSRELRV